MAHVHIRFRPRFDAEFGPVEVWPTLRLAAQQLQIRTGARPGISRTRVMDADGLAVYEWEAFPDADLSGAMAVWTKGASLDGPADQYWFLSAGGAVLAWMRATGRTVPRDPAFKTATAA
ncbi:hypothetical protein ACIOUE_07105 [Streptomyces xanthochromogenes]|uniref:hypothetical protein n=1 Tax=Streptomyces xanthochromogenes TaxID=67384 RepID=UPI00343FD667